jgi:hypothetical protein
VDVESKIRHHRGRGGSRHGQAQQRVIRTDVLEKFVISSVLDILSGANFAPKKSVERFFSAK